MQNHTEKQIMLFKTTVSSFNDKWYYLVIGCFYWKIGVFQQAIASVYYILKLDFNYFTEDIFAIILGKSIHLISGRYRCLVPTTYDILFITTLYSFLSSYRYSRLMLYYQQYPVCRKKVTWVISIDPNINSKPKAWVRIGLVRSVCKQIISENSFYFLL